MIHYLEDPTFWVALAFIALIALLWKKLSGFTVNALDSRASRIKSDMAKAASLREEAQELLLTYKRRHAHYLKEAEQIITQARSDAENLAASADAELKRSIESRTQMAVEKIAQTEAKAITKIRNEAVDIAVKSAHSLLIEQLKQSSPDVAFQRSLSDISHVLH